LVFKAKIRCLWIRKSVVTDSSETSEYNGLEGVSWHPKTIVFLVIIEVFKVPNLASGNHWFLKQNPLYFGTFGPFSTVFSFVFKGFSRGIPATVKTFVFTTFLKVFEVLDLASGNHWFLKQKTVVLGHCPTKMQRIYTIFKAIFIGIPQQRKTTDFLRNT